MSEEMIDVETVDVSAVTWGQWQELTQEEQDKLVDRVGELRSDELADLCADKVLWVMFCGEKEFSAKYFIQIPLEHVILKIAEEQNRAPYQFMQEPQRH